MNKFNELSRAEMKNVTGGLSCNVDADCGDGGFCDSTTFTCGLPSVSSCTWSYIGHTYSNVCHDTPAACQSSYDAVCWADNQCTNVNCI